MDGLPDLLKPCRGGFEVQDRGEESLQFIQVSTAPSICNGNHISGNLGFSVSRSLSKTGGTKLPSGNKTTLCKSRAFCVNLQNHELYSLPNLYQLQSSQEVLYDGDQCLLAPSPPPLLIPASSVTPVTPPFSLDSLCPPTTQNPAQVPKGKLSPAEV